MKNIKLMLFSFGVVVLALTSGSAQHTSPNGSNGSARLVISSPNHDFGEIVAGTPLKHSFVFKNAGKSDLIIQSVTPG
jgi:hypothetical protein